MVDGAEPEEFFQKHQKQLKVLVVILLVLALSSVSIHIGDKLIIITGNETTGNVTVVEKETGNRFDLPKIIEDICRRVFSQNVNCLGS